MITQFKQDLISILAPEISHLELSLGGSLAKAATELLNSMDSDTCYEVDTLREALEAWAMGKPVADARALFESWHTDFTIHGRKMARFFDRKADGTYTCALLEDKFVLFSAGFKITHADVSIDLRRDLEGLRAQVAALQDPEVVLVNMLKGNIAKLSARSISKLYGDVINGDEAQLAEIARLRAALAEETIRADNAEKELESARQWIGPAEELFSELRNHVDDEHQARIDEFVES